MKFAFLGNEKVNEGAVNDKGEVVKRMRKRNFESKIFLEEESFLEIFCCFYLRSDNE